MRVGKDVIDNDVSGPPARWWLVDLLNRCCDAKPSCPFVVPYTFAFVRFVLVDCLLLIALS
jgi:hypothetical protein